jgi:hypothetical protein
MPVVSVPGKTCCSGDMISRLKERGTVTRIGSQPDRILRADSGARATDVVETGRSNFSPDEIVTSVLGAVMAKKEEGRNAKTEKQKQALNARGSGTNITGWALDPV